MNRLFLSNGALAIHERLGVVRDRTIGKHRWVVTRVVERRACTTPGRGR